MTAIAIAATACSNAGATVARATSAAPTSTLASPAASPSRAAQTEAASPGTAVPSGPADGWPASPEQHADKGLEAALPDAYQGVTLRKGSVRLSDQSSETPQTRDLVELAQSLGKTAADVILGLAFDPKHPVMLFYAWRINGVHATAWWPRFRELIVNAVPGTTASEVALGGRTVTHFVSPTGRPILYAWPQGDFVFNLIVTTEAQADDAIAAVP